MPNRAALITWPLYLFAAAAPFSVAAGNLAAGLIMVAAIVYLLVTRDRAALPHGAVIVALVVYLAIHALADAFAAPYPTHWDKWTEELWLKLLLVAIPVLGYRDPGQLVRAVKVAVLFGTVAAVYAIFQHFAGVDIVGGRHLHQAQGHYHALGFFNHHLSYGGHAMLLFLFAAAWAALRGFGRRWQRWWHLIPALLLFAALMWTYARSPQIGAAAGLMVIVLSLPRRKRKFGLAAGVALAAATMALPTVRWRFSQLFVGGEPTRINLWRSSAHGIADRPLLGFGQGNFDRMLEHYEVAGFYDVRGHAHNDFVMHAVNAGVLGLLAALALLVVVTWLLWRGYRRTLTRDAPYGWVLLGGVAAQVAVSVAGLFQVYQTDDEVEMLLYFLLGCGLGLLPRVRWTAAVTDTRRLTSIAILAVLVTTAGASTAFAFA